MEGRYARQVYIPQWDQARLHDAKVIIIGVGALGTEVARLLASSGVGTLTLCDPDLVEESNLNRGALFDSTHIGMRKVTAAAGTLAVQFSPLLDGYRPEIGLGSVCSLVTDIASSRDYDLSEGSGSPNPAAATGRKRRQGRE